jgi:capsule polysaccharide export protein KpsE/RkpR
MQTKRDALELTYEDKNPEMAAIVANAIRERINSLATRLIKDSQHHIIESYKTTIIQKSEALNIILDSLSYYRQKHKIYSPIEQSEYLSGRLTEIESGIIGLNAKISSLERIRSRSQKINDSLSFMRASLSASQQELLVLDSDTSQSNYSLRNFNKARGKVEILEEAYNRANSQLSADRERLKFFEAGYNLDISALKVIEEATVPVVKHRPKKSIVILASTAAAFIFSVIGVLLFVAYREVDWKQITEEGKENEFQTSSSSP